MIQSTSMEERFLGAFALSFWGDNEGRKTLLKLLVKTQKRSVSHIKRLRLESMRLLFKWDKRINWKGMALPQDLPLFLPLLRDNHREIRLRIALYLGHLGSIHKSHRRHLTPKVRTFLARSVNFPTKQLAILAAITLADLGQRNGVLYLRQLYGQFGASKRHRIARILQNNYQDYWGKRAVLAMYKGRYASNLVLPSFRIIYASLLYNYQQYNDALFHFQRTFKLARKSVTPQHKAMALFGMSRCFYKLKRYKLSIQKLKQAKQIDPFIRGFASTLGQNHYRLGQYKQAKTQLANAWRMTGGTPHILRYMTLLSLQQNKTREAARRLQKTLSNTPEQTHEGYLYQYVRAWIEARPNSTKTALKIVNKLLNMREKHPLYLRLKATILHRQKRFKAAQKTFNEAIIQTAPDSHHRPIYIKQFKALYKRTPKLHTPKP
jgi:tetratricopeptide (TPR) repeat protein